MCWANDDIIVAAGLALLRRRLRQIGILLAEGGMSADWTDPENCSWAGTHAGGAAIEVAGNAI